MKKKQHTNKQKTEFDREVKTYLNSEILKEL